MSKLKSILAISLLASLLLLIATATYASVELQSFTANWEENKVSLKWKTGSESDIAGFYVWRSETNLTVDANDKIDTTQPGVTRLTTNPQPIVNPDGGCNVAASREYEHSDNVTDATVTTYYYYLEAIKCVGSNTEFYGNEEATGLQVDQATLPGSTIYLPVMLRN